MNSIRSRSSPHEPTARAVARTTLATAALAALAASAPAQQARFSIEHRSPTVGEPDSFSGIPISPGDVLVPATANQGPAYGPLPNPGILIPRFPCTGGTGGTSCPQELDALSGGNDHRLRPASLPAGTYVFSVDLCSSGIPGSMLAPNVATEAPVQDQNADVFEDLGLPPAPLGPMPGATARGNTGIIDGDGLTSPSGALYVGLGLFEPGMLTVLGDELDAVDLDAQANALYPLYFSFDGAIVDPCTGFAGSGTAASHGISPADVLVRAAPGGPVQVYASGAQLGLDFGLQPDDLDALALAENGIPGFQASQTPFDWLPGPSQNPRDMLLFSVRRGSPIVGRPDSIFGLPIEPGDVLTTPQAGGVSPFPGIFVAAEWLGLRTARVTPAGLHADDLDALDTREVPQTGLPYCFGTDSNCPCANGGAPGHGCANSAFPDGGLLSASGTASVSNDSVSLLATSITSNSHITFQGTTQIQSAFGDGLRCAGGSVIRLGYSNPYPGPGDLPVSVKGAIPNAGAMRTYQFWYRNAAPFCTNATFNLTNGLVILWTP